LTLEVFPVSIAARLKDFGSGILQAKEPKKLDRFTLYARLRGLEAVADAKITEKTVDPTE
jgi:3-oxoacyl-(acyl-carrier-protein) synthase